MHFSIILLCCVSLVHYCLCECNYKTCRECISVSGCGWCIGEKALITNCLNITQSASCTNPLINPKSEIQLQNVLNIESQFSPSKVKLKIRPHHPLNLKFEYKHKYIKPLDIYFLMDISATMKSHREELAQLAKELVQSFSPIVKDVQLGFGSFVDKITLPYVNDNFTNFKNMCPGCAIPYSFENNLSPTADIDKFSQELNKIKLSGNIDSPEGTLDALMQVIVCSKEIGWRNDAWKLIVVATDDYFHIAGDGRLAGIVEPNDEQCHLENNIYTYDRLQDYPSIGQIKNKAKEKNVFILFAVTESIKDIYEKLANVKDNIYIGILSNSSSIANIVQKNYKEIISAVKFRHDFDPIFNISISATCKNFNKDIDTCPDVHLNNSITVSVKINLNSCPTDEEFTNALNHIFPSGPNDHISFDIDFLCKCPCETTIQKNSSECSSVGNFTCGMCFCPENLVGKNCECNALLLSSKLDRNACIQPNSTKVCSGSGYCICGQCMCDTYRTGKYCECNEKYCANDNNEICSNNGKCDCNTCKCNFGWKGDKCQCTEDVTDCINRDDNKNLICSGRNYGHCECGKCVCKEVDGHQYSGEYCEKCVTCPKIACDTVINNCVECIIFERDDAKLEECQKSCENVTIIPTDDEFLEENYYDIFCSFRDASECTIKYKIDKQQTFLNRSTYILAYKEKICTTLAATIFSSWFFIPIITLLVAVLLAFAIFKIKADLDYKREFAKYEEAQKATKWHEDPLYRSPITVVQNPGYMGNTD